MTTEHPANAITWFEIPTEDYDRAVGFYETVLNTKLQPNTMDGMTFAQFPADETGVPGCVAKESPSKPGDAGTVIYLTCADLDASLARAPKAGGSVAMDKMALPNDLGHIALIVDCEGNKVGLHQPQ